MRKLLVAALLVSASFACVRVRPWQREHLSRRGLDFSSERAESKFKSHLFESREGARGGYGEAGGGCGCN